MKYWIVPSNNKLFRMEAALRANNGILDWQTGKMSVGDIVFMYKTMPDGCIKYMMEVVKTGFTRHEAIDQRAFWEDKQQLENSNKIYSRLKLIETLDERKLSLYTLRLHGVNGNIQGKQACPQETVDYILQSID